MGRVILHCDANSFYASIEICYRPWLKRLPVAVGGDAEARHGIVLTANTIAKKQYGVRTAEALWQARQKCPNLVILPADFPLYIHFSRMMRGIVEEYSDRVEAFGLDENWIDLSGKNVTLADGERIAQEIRQRIRDELGITVSIGVADNKVIAKLGSDIKKPDAVTVLPRSEYPRKVWPLPVGELLYVGPATRRKLQNIGVMTIGDLACCDPGILRGLLGKNGLMLRAFARGEDMSPVRHASAESAIKSVGNSITTPRDMETPEDVRCVLYLLCESVAARLREHGLRSRCVTLSIRSTELITNSCQCMLDHASSLSGEIAQAACGLFSARFADRLPLRSIGVSCGQLEAMNAPVQFDLFGDAEHRLRMERLECAIDGLRKRFGHQVVQRGVVHYDEKFAGANPREEHVIHPVSYFG